ncbi:MAG: nucleotidyltransferase domain-containing protein [Thermoplasmata archaeon]
MNSFIGGRTSDIARICAKYRVRRLCLFGSARGPSFVPGRSDVDFLVEFESMPPAEHADCYFGLLEELERLLGTGVDVVEATAVRNPYFRRVLERDQELIYAAA